MDLLYHHGETLHHSVQNINIFNSLDIYYTHTVVKVGFKTWQMHGKCRAVWGLSAPGQGGKPPEVGGILMYDAKNKIETEKINSNKSYMKK